MKYFVLAFFLLTAFRLQAQETGGSEVLPKDTYRYPENIAKPVKGLESFYTDFANQFNFDALSSPDVTAFKCILNFFVEKDGSLTDINVKMDSFRSGMEAVRLIKAMPKWKPATEKGKIVRSIYELHLNIKKPVKKIKEEPAQ